MYRPWFNSDCWFQTFDDRLNLISARSQKIEQSIGWSAKGEKDILSGSRWNGLKEVGMKSSTEVLDHVQLESQRQLIVQVVKCESQGFPSSDFCAINWVSRTQGTAFFESDKTNLIRLGLWTLTEPPDSRGEWVTPILPAWVENRSAYVSREAQTANRNLKTLFHISSKIHIWLNYLNVI